MKSLVIINEPLGNMALGRNTTLAYIVSCLDLGHEVYVYNLIKNLPKSSTDTISATYLSNDNLGKLLITEYKKLNKEIMLSVAENNLEKLNSLKTLKVTDFLQTELRSKKVKLNEIGFISQRLEPMKAPFPPAGQKDVNKTLKNLKELFPHLIFNCPLNLGDKDTPLEINNLLQEKIATPTAEFALEDSDFSEAIAKMNTEYQEIYNLLAAKIVLKPKNAAQSLGVFAITFVEDGMNLNSIQKTNVSELKKLQNYRINNDLSEDELREIIKILCYVQNAKNSDFIENIDQTEIFSTAKELYKDELLVQPFLEGVKFGDIRVNLLKNSEGNFYLAGNTFRKSLRKESNSFTTTYSTGGATSQPVNILAKKELKNLNTKTADVLRILNNELKQKYQTTTELGLDFMLVGDDENIFLGEINHHCQALIPISEAMEKAVDENAIYEGGLGFTKKAVEDAILMQKG